MKKVPLCIGLIIMVLGCGTRSSSELKEGEWRATMQVSDNEQLPFNFTLTKEDETNYVLTIKNAEEEIRVDEFAFNADSIRINMPVFEGYILGTYSENRIQGNFIKESLDRIVPFEAEFGEKPRFERKLQPEFDVSGIWETEFNYGTDSLYVAKGIFEQNEGRVIGTFRTKTGDYRYLEGIVDGNRLKLSTFDGAHVFLFTAQVTDSTLNGKFYSGNHYTEIFRAKRNPNFELPDANTLTFLKEGYERFDFSFPDAQGNQIGINDDSFKNKVVLVQIMGTWCPNCLDETKFYVDYLKNNPNSNLKVIALAFEYAKTEAKAFASIQRLVDRVEVPYPVLLAQTGTSSKTKANEKLPMLNHVLSYPTTIYIDKKGNVRKIHTGFNGPATGVMYEKFKKEFDQTIDGLLAE
ncbi:MAG: TlpA family protein disulfide reductase [Croceitalea sp.]|nr:TlpA family protein disulfide reductase [Croceitalea sp.]